MDKLTRLLYGWFMIVPISGILMLILALFFHDSNGQDILILSGFLLIAFMLWMIYVELNEINEKILGQKLSKEKSTHE
ncbi:MAG: hypothetical protein A2Y20_07700 [Firmicutes bacterium GWF2_51_9]|nr:MAG: hypothetical protein A2Y20_07700 [Firmicutes bacterium GWF2_51_9]OGS58478.1 MAG: hypothetical protein A2Y19_00550 [Firmicutes bacterium GWE2_51_13]HAM63774.1 hypothetical protein [Erysipelotrichaceae bacterium]